MNHKIFALFCLLILSSPAHSASKVSGETDYQTLRDWVKVSAPVQYKEVEDSAYEGSCFSAFDQNHITSWYFVATHVDAGPALTQRKVALATKERSGSLREILSEVTFDLVWSVFKTVLVDESSSLFWKQEGTPGEVLMGEVRRYQSYLVTDMIMDYEGICPDWASNFCKPGETIKRGSSTEACYFYQKIQ